MKWQAELVCLVALVAGGARGQEVAANLPDMPEPKVETVRSTVSVPVRPHSDIHRFDRRVFWSMTSALAASQIADTLTTESVINHGGHEQNPIFGQHPEPVPYGMTNLGIFTAQVGIFYLTEHSKHPAIRWTGRAFIAAVTVNHARLAACNANINPRSVLALWINSDNAVAYYFLSNSANNPRVAFMRPRG